VIYLKRYRGKEKEEFSPVDIKFVFYAVYYPTSLVLYLNRYRGKEKEEFSPVSHLHLCPA
jgi:hypothetical protein